MIGNSNQEEKILSALSRFAIELPSWGFGNTGTRFGKFFDPTAASSIDEKIHDAALVHQLVGCCPAVALHVLWDCPDLDNVEPLLKLASDSGIQIGAINPNLFQEQKYKFPMR